MSQIINAVREIMNEHKAPSMNVNEIMKKIVKGAYQMKIRKEDLSDVLDHYKKLNVIYVDPEENIIFL